MNSRAKGKRGELEARNALRETLGCVDAKRGQQRSGLEQADVVDAIPGTHIEVKRRKSIASLAFNAQAERDAEIGDVPMVLMRADRGGWYVCVKLNDLRALAQRVAAIDGQLIFPFKALDTASPDAIIENDHAN